MVIFVHGGGFFLCGIETHDEICRLLARDSGCRVLAVGCLLSPESKPDDQLRQVVDVCHWARANAAQIGCDGLKIGLAGDSAGAYLATLAALALNKQHRMTVRQLLLLYPLTQTSDEEWAVPTLADFRFIGRIACIVIRHITGCTSPSLFTSELASLPPTTIVTGRCDPTTADAHRLATELVNSGVPVSLHRHPFLPHGSLNLTTLAPFARRAIEKAAVTIANSW